MAISRRRLETMRQIVSGVEPPMARVALDDIANPAAARHQLQAEFEKALRGKESTDQLITRLRHVVEMSRGRAARIAQTEKTRAFNSARLKPLLEEYMTAYDKAVKDHRKRPDRPLVQWINPRYAREPRPRHVAISGTKRPVGDEFLPGLKYPGDPDAPAREVINCHCYIRRVTR